MATNRQIDESQVVEKLRDLADRIESKGTEVVSYTKVYTDEPAHERFELHLTHKLINRQELL